MVRDTMTSTPIPPSQLPATSSRGLWAAVRRVVNHIRIAHYQRHQVDDAMRQERAVAHVMRVRNGARDYI